MSEKKVVTPAALAVGAALAGYFALGTSAASAATAESPFAMSALGAGYMLGTGEGSCGGAKDGEAACGGDKEGGADGKDGEATCGGDKDAEGACGEGTCGGSAG